MEKKLMKDPKKKRCQELLNNITNLHMRLPGYESNRIYDHTIPEALSDNERVNPKEAKRRVVSLQMLQPNYSY